MLLLALLYLLHLYVFTNKYINWLSSRNIEISEWKSVDQEGNRVLAFRRLDVTASAPRRAGKGRGGRTRRQEQDTRRNANVSRRIQSPLSHFLEEDATLQNIFSQEDEGTYKIVFIHLSQKKSAARQRRQEAGHSRIHLQFVTLQDITCTECILVLHAFAQYIYYMH